MAAITDKSKKLGQNGQCSCLFYLVIKKQVYVNIKLSLFIYQLKKTHHQSCKVEFLFWIFLIQKQDVLAASQQ